MRVKQQLSCRSVNFTFALTLTQLVACSVDSDLHWPTLASSVRAELRSCKLLTCMVYLHPATDFLALLQGSPASRTPLCCFTLLCTLQLASTQVQSATAQKTKGATLRAAQYLIELGEKYTCENTPFSSPAVSAMLSNYQMQSCLNWISFWNLEKK